MYEGTEYSFAGGVEGHEDLVWEFAGDSIKRNDRRASQIEVDAAGKAKFTYLRLDGREWTGTGICKNGQCLLQVKIVVNDGKQDIELNQLMAITFVGDRMSFTGGNERNRFGGAYLRK